MPRDHKAFQLLRSWLPAVLMMAIIFLFSSRPASALPDFHWADGIVKKGGHLAGYGLLALAFWRALNFRMRQWWLAWLLALLYALTDEFHQSLVPGRHPSMWDVLVFDNLGALISLALVSSRQMRRSGRPGAVVGQLKS